MTTTDIRHMAPEQARVFEDGEMVAEIFRGDHAFEDQAARRVCLKTDSRNQRSRQAILRLGAVEEGTWRNHRIAWDGADRHSVFFSVIDTEWPDVKRRLEGLMRR